MTFVEFLSDNYIWIIVVATVLVVGFVVRADIIGHWSDDRKRTVDYRETKRTAEIRRFLTHGVSSNRSSGNSETVSSISGPDVSERTPFAHSAIDLPEALTQDERLTLIQEDLAKIDVDAVKREYWAQDEFVFIRNAVSPRLIRAIQADVNSVRPIVNRNYVPNFKKGGSVDYARIRSAIPQLADLYHHPAMVDLIATVTGAHVQLCPENDPHACALYLYTEAGDHIDWHYDTSFYRGVRYTVLLSIFDQSSSELCYQLHTRANNRDNKDNKDNKGNNNNINSGNDNNVPAIVHGSTRTGQGNLVIFHGDKLWHKVSPCQAGEDRVMLTMEFVTRRDMSLSGRIISTVKDGVGYFGWKAAIKGLFTRGN